MAERDREGRVLASAAAFERWLLDAAGSDGPPPGAAEAAWAQFEEAAGRAWPHETSARSGSPAAPGSNGAAPGSNGAAPGSGGAAPAAKWIGVGALGGTIVGGLLAAFVLRGGVESAPARAEPAAAGAEAPAREGSEVRDPEPVGAPALPARADDAHRRDDDGVSPHRGSMAKPLPRRPLPRRPLPRGPLPRGPGAKPQRDGERSARVASMPTSPSDAPGVAGPSAPVERERSLEREVALLDAIRVANEGGDFAKGLELVARYRGEFEDGELARDADVFEIEALAGEGERARAARAARSFLSRYPGDPHTQRVRTLAADGLR
jgi:hypothetical protein